MDTLTLYITEENRMLTLTSYVKGEIGNRFDNMAQKLVFIRPPGREADNLVLYFKTFCKKFGPINLGTQNEFVVTNALTAQLELDLQVAFSTGEPVKHSNIIRFKLRESINPGTETVDANLNPVLQLSQEAFTDIVYDGLTLTFYNLAGDPVKELAITGGGGADPTFDFLEYVDGKINELENNSTAIIGEF